MRTLRPILAGKPAANVVAAEAEAGEADATVHSWARLCRRHHRWAGGDAERAWVRGLLESGGADGAGGGCGGSVWKTRMSPDCNPLSLRLLPAMSGSIFKDSNSTSS